MAEVVERRDHTARFFLIVAVAVVGIPAALYFALTRTTHLGPGPKFPAGAVCFIGSSTIARFPLAREFPDKICVNLGVPDQDALGLRARLAADLPADRSPAGLVLYAGSFDLRAGAGLAAPEVRDRVAAVVKDLRSRFPQAPMALIEVLPARSQTDAERGALAELNDGLVALARDSRAAFVRTHRPPLTDAGGNLLESMSVDRFHLNEAGYRVLAKWIQEDGGAVGEMLR